MCRLFSVQTEEYAVVPTMDAADGDRLPTDARDPAVQRERMTLDQQGRADVGRMLGDHVHGLRPLFAHDRDAAFLHDPRLLNSDLGNGRLDLYQAVAAWRQALGIR